MVFLSQFEKLSCNELRNIEGGDWIKFLNNRLNNQGHILR
ncbi:hypothetical protein GCM10025879_12150 [Leuconostoc litchii]|nr:hypothetical protein GCM10025879_12150 [Leuconostoc litchii]